ncbi:MAG: RluA family pseudouridine synthase [Myxococcota bacterium]
MRLDTFLARWFRDFSRSALSRGVKAGQVCSEGRPLRAGARVRGGQVLDITIEGIAPDGPPPPFPPILLERDGLLVVDKPAGMLCHPTGTTFAWALVGLARERHPDVELVHRLDRDTSGCIALTTDPTLNRHLKLAIKEGRTRKEYEAIVKGEIPWDRKRLDGPIGPADGEIRIQMAIRDDGKPARTDVTVIGRQPGYTRVRCRIHTGRTHQIRIHLAHEGFPLLGDRLYGVAPEVFLHTLEHGVDASTREATGAPYHALHAAELELPLPGGAVVVRAPMPEVLERWWAHPEVLPHDGEAP